MFVVLCHFLLIFFCREPRFSNGPQFTKSSAHVAQRHDLRQVSHIIQIWRRQTNTYTTLRNTQLRICSIDLNGNWIYIYMLGGWCGKAITFSSCIIYRKPKSLCCLVLFETTNRFVLYLFVLYSSGVSCELDRMVWRQSNWAVVRRHKHVFEQKRTHNMHKRNNNLCAMFVRDEFQRFVYFRKNKQDIVSQ